MTKAWTDPHNPGDKLLFLAGHRLLRRCSNGFWLDSWLLDIPEFEEKIAFHRLSDEEACLLEIEYLQFIGENRAKI